MTQESRFIEAELAAWKSAFPGKTPGEVRAIMVKLESIQSNLANGRNVYELIEAPQEEIDQLKRERDEAKELAKTECARVDDTQKELNDALAKLAAAESKIIELSCQLGKATPPSSTVPMPHVDWRPAPNQHNKKDL